MRVLVLNQESKLAIDRVVKFAHENPITMARLEHGVQHPEIAVGDDERQRVIVPMDYRCVFSVEEQPMGLVRHLSVSVPRKGYTPSPEAMAMLMSAFGFSEAFVAFIMTATREGTKPPPNALVYIEKIDYTAINVVEKIS